MSKKGFYNSYIGKDDLIKKAIKTYLSGNETQKEICKKYDINFHSFKRLLPLYKKNQNMEGGELNNKTGSIFVNKKNNNSSNTSNKNNIPYLSDENKRKNDKEREKQAIEMMNNLGGRGNRNKHSGFTDIIEEQEKKKNQSNQPKRQEVSSFKNFLNVDKLRNELEEERRNVDN